jgi:ABC-type phosphate transport system substrate-binding protein
MYAAMCVVIGAAVYGSAQTSDAAFLDSASLEKQRQPEIPPVKPIKHHEKEQGEEPIVVLVHPSNRTSDLTLGQLARIYRGEVTEWPDGRPITVINRPIQSEVRARFYQIVLGVKPTHPFYQPDSPFPFETRRVEPEPVVAKFIARDPSAIAYCYRSCADGPVKILRIEGQRPGEDDYALH